jgi:hypothetical protein
MRMRIIVNKRFFFTVRPFSNFRDEFLFILYLFFQFYHHYHGFSDEEGGGAQ